MDKIPLASLLAILSPGDPMAALRSGYSDPMTDLRGGKFNSLAALLSSSPQIGQQSMNDARAAMYTQSQPISGN
jgi:hypothetical protein